MLIKKLIKPYWPLAAVIIAACTPQEKIEDFQKRLTRQHDLIIRAGEPANFYVPPYTKADAKLPEGKMLQASSTVLHDSLKGIEAALNSYPEGFVASLINAIFISGELWFDGERAGGTYLHSWLIVASTTRPGKESNYQAALYGVHHELSSFVFNKSPLTGITWQKLMPANWQEANGYAQALDVDRSLAPDYHNGFLSKYAETSVENDFNTYAEFVFGKEKELTELAREYPRIAKKLGLFISAYSTLSPEMALQLGQSSLTLVAKKPALLKMSTKGSIPQPKIING